jgi:DNA repair exonuclease SbcCD nuclease subunit
MVTLLHTADWQIGKQFANIPGDTGAILRERRIESVKKIAAIANQKNVDAVLAAGDIFDTNLVQGKTLLQTLGAMADFSGKWICIPGNHDSAEVDSVWARYKRNFGSENIVLLDKPEPYYLKNTNVVILPAPLQRRHDSRDLTEWFDSCETDPSLIRVGLAHGSINNRLMQRSEAPNTISDTRADTARLDYLALGDWHGTSKIAPRTWYSGTPETDRFRENDSGNVLLVEIDAPGSEPRVTSIESGHFKWLSHDVSVFQAADLESLRHTLIDTGVPLDRILLRLTLTGAVSLETRSLIDTYLELLSAELRYLETDNSGLRAEPTQADLDEIERSGFVRMAINKLTSIVADGGNEDTETARLALQLLYVEHKHLESNHAYKKN